MKTTSIFILFALLTVSCNNETANDSQGNNQNVQQSSRSIMLADVPASPEFPDARLSMDDVKATANGDSVKISFSFGVKNYELKNQTADAEGKQCNNSEKGQHIHFILDNKPYVALYEPKHEVTLVKNTEHYLMAFLSRSYHESVKSPGAALVYHFKIDGNGRLQKLEDPKTPMIFYSRPKGDYLGKDTENVLFDFYVWNASLGDQQKIKAEIRGAGLDTTLMINEWKPRFLKNLPMGKNSIRLTLVDASGNAIEGPETSVTREFNLSQDEPIK